MNRRQCTFVPSRGINQYIQCPRTSEIGSLCHQHHLYLQRRRRQGRPVSNFRRERPPPPAVVDETPEVIHIDDDDDVNEETIRNFQNHQARINQRRRSIELMHIVSDAFDELFPLDETDINDFTAEFGDFIDSYLQSRYIRLDHFVLSSLREDNVGNLSPLANLVHAMLYQLPLPIPGVDPIDIDEFLQGGGPPPPPTLTLTEFEELPTSQTTQGICVICLEDKVNKTCRVMPCNHSLCDTCGYQQLVQTKAECPECRFRFGAEHRLRTDTDADATATNAIDAIDAIDVD
jgi:hypothetical protein